MSTSAYPSLGGGLDTSGKLVNDSQSDLGIQYLTLAIFEGSHSYKVVSAGTQIYWARYDSDKNQRPLQLSYGQSDQHQQKVSSILRKGRFSKPYGSQGQPPRETNSTDNSQS
jgi:hypothetical protein